MFVILRVLFVRKRSRMCDVVVVVELPSPAVRVVVCVRVGLCTVCESENVFMMSMKSSCNWRLFVWGMMGLGTSASGGSLGDVAVQSMSGRLKSPVIQMCLSGEMRDREVWRCLR